MSVGRRGWADLPFDVLRRVVQDAEEFTPPGPQGMWGYQRVAAAQRSMTLAEALAAGQVCRSWSRGLASPTVGSLTIGGGAPPGKRAWLARARPGARSLRIYCSAASQEGQELLGCLRGGDTVAAEVGQVPRCLPDPAVLPNLRSLTIRCLEADASWLARLAAVPHLASLEVAVAARKQQAGYGDGNDAGQPLELPALVALHRLKAYLEPGAPLLRVCLDRLPALEAVELWGSQGEDDEHRGSAELACSGGGTPSNTSTGGTSPSHLRRISFDLSRARVDWAALPAVQEAEVLAAELQGSGSLAAATQLTNLQLGSDAALSSAFGVAWEYSLDKPWLLEALASLPPSLRVLCLKGGRLPRAAAEAVARLSCLPVLCLSVNEEPEMLEEEEVEEGQEEAELGPGPLWEGLRALRWASWQRLPRALAGAKHLQVLDWHGVAPMPTKEEVRLLASLPALRHLLIAVRGSPPAKLEAQLLRALPRLRSLRLGSMMQSRSEAAFLRAAEEAGASGGQA